jgi:hypothetical protein
MLTVRLSQFGDIAPQRYVTPTLRLLPLMMSMYCTEWPASIGTWCPPIVIAPHASPLQDANAFANLGNTKSESTQKLISVLVKITQSS